MYRLLVADDEMIERAVLVQLLEEELGDQCRIFQAENGREALEVYEKEKIQIAVLDIAGLLFGFSIYMGMLGQVENGEKINAKKLCMSAFHTPAFIASVLGILAGLSKVVICLIDSPFGGAYLAVEGILTTSVTAIILIVVGYSMELTKELIRPCLKTILMRVLLQTLMAIGVLWAVHLWIGDNILLNLAIISYMSAPATFSMQTFLKKEEGSAYVSTTNSMYCMVSILVYIILAAVVY